MPKYYLKTVWRWQTWIYFLQYFAKHFAVMEDFRPACIRKLDPSVSSFNCPSPTRWNTLQRFYFQFLCWTSCWQQELGLYVVMYVEKKKGVSVWFSPQISFWPMWCLGMNRADWDPGAGPTTVLRNTEPSPIQLNFFSTVSPRCSSASSCCCLWVHLCIIQQVWQAARNLLVK